MIRPMLFLLILFFPFFVINLHRINQQKKSTSPKIKWKYIYIIFVFFYVLFVLYAAEVFDIT